MPEIDASVIGARRALLRQQTELLGPRLPWLADPALVPDHAVDASVEDDDVRLAAFSLAAWMLIDLVQAAGQVNHALDRHGVMESFHIAPRARESLSLAVLCPLSRHAPGLIAIAEIMAVIPLLAHRADVPANRWGGIALGSLAFGAMLARDGTAVQVLLRSYLGRSEAGPAGAGIRSLDPALLRLQGETGITTVTPLPDLLAAARCAAARYNVAPRGVCVALQAPAPEAAGGRGTTMFGAIWASFAAAAERLVFPHFDPSRDAIPAEAAIDSGYADALEHAAARRHDELVQVAAQPYPPAAERVLGNLLAAAQRAPSRAP